MCDPANRESRPVRFGPVRSRMTANVMIPASTADREQVLDEADDRPVADDRDGEAAAEQVAVGLDDGQQQDDEAPERQRVRHPGHRPPRAACAARSPRWPGPPRPGRGARARLATRSGAGWPARPTRYSHHSRRPASAARRRQRDPDDDTQDHADLLMRRLPAPRRVRHCRADTSGSCAAPLPVQGTPRTAPAEIIRGCPGTRRAPAISRILPVGNLTGLYWPRGAAPLFFLTSRTPVSRE